MIPAWINYPIHGLLLQSLWDSLRCACSNLSPIVILDYTKHEWTCVNLSSHHEIKELLICEDALYMFYNYNDHIMWFVSKSLVLIYMYMECFDM